MTNITEYYMIICYRKIICSLKQYKGVSNEKSYINNYYGVVSGQVLDRKIKGVEYKHPLSLVLKSFIVAV